jgi:putative endonuclease
MIKYHKAYCLSLLQTRVKLNPCPKYQICVIPAQAGIPSAMEKAFYVYMLASERNGTLYLGVTSNLVKRIWEHREGLFEGFTKKYGVKHLVWFEVHTEAMAAITREKQLKKWNRDWKIKMIQQENPDWRDLYEDITT